jgi:malic enzyme
MVMTALLQEPKVGRDHALALLREMLRIRRFEEKCAELYSAGKIQGFLHLYEHTNKANCIAIVTDGTRVLGLGDIGPEAGLPVMEGKALLFKYL